MALSAQQQDANAVNEAKARILAAAARIGKVFPDLSTAIVAEIENGRSVRASGETFGAWLRGERQRLYAYANEIEATQAALVLGLSCTEKGNNIDHRNLDTTTAGAALAERTGAIRALYQGR